MENKTILVIKHVLSSLSHKKNYEDRAITHAIQIIYTTKKFRFYKT